MKGTHSTSAIVAKALLVAALLPALVVGRWGSIPARGSRSVAATDSGEHQRLLGRRQV